MGTHPAASINSDKAGSDFNVSLSPFSLSGEGDGWSGTCIRQKIFSKAVLLLLMYTWPMHIHVHVHM